MLIIPAPRGSAAEVHRGKSGGQTGQGPQHLPSAAILIVAVLGEGAYLLYHLTAEVVAEVQVAV